MTEIQCAQPAPSLIDSLLMDIDQIARDRDIYEYGLPIDCSATDGPMEAMREKVRAALAAQPGPAYSREHHIALREAHHLDCEESYFGARPELCTDQHRRLFAAGYGRGFDDGARVASQSTPSPAEGAGTKRYRLVHKDSGELHRIIGPSDPFDLDSWEQRECRVEVEPAETQAAFLDDVYQQCCDAIKPLVDEGHLPGSVVESLQMLVAEKRAALASNVQPKGAQVEEVELLREKLAIAIEGRDDAWAKLVEARRQLQAQAAQAPAPAQRAELVRLLRWCMVTGDEGRCFTDRVESALKQVSSPAVKPETKPGHVDELARLLDALIDHDADLAERFIEKHLGRLALKRRLEARRAASQPPVHHTGDANG